MSFIDHFSTVSDPRKNINKVHNLFDILFLTVSALLCGVESWDEIEQFGHSKIDWLKKHRPFDAGIPSHDTIARVISAIDPDVLAQSFIAWVNELRQEKGRDIIALDGKTLRGSFTGDRQTALHVLSAWSKEHGLALGQLRSAGKKNEIKTIPILLDLLDVEGTIVTCDAMGCQKDIAAKVVEKKADYVFGLKGNQGNLCKETQAWFHKNEREGIENIEYSEFKEVSKGHGRIDERAYLQIPITNWVSGSEEWSGLKSVIRVQRKRHIGGKITEDVSYYISSLAVDAEEAARAIRGHWGVENSLHHLLDMTFREDASRIRKGNAAENMSTLRKVAVNLLKQEKSQTKLSVKRKRFAAILDEHYLDKIIFG